MTDSLPQGDIELAWMQTYSGGAFTPLDPKVEDIHLGDIAVCLSRLARFNGHTTQFYSVAQHSVSVSYLLDDDPDLARWGLMHDAAETYISDVPYPVKQMIPEFKKIDVDISRVIAQKFHLDPLEMPQEVKEADLIMLMTEKRDLMALEPKPWAAVNVVPAKFKIMPWSIEQSYVEFMKRFNELFTVTA